VELGLAHHAAADAPLPVEADGELAGSTPAEFRCLRGALRLVTA
jgi:diacylglycerol kinase family enzyme